MISKRCLSTSTGKKIFLTTGSTLCFRNCSQDENPAWLKAVEAELAAGQRLVVDSLLTADTYKCFTQVNLETKGSFAGERRLLLPGWEKEEEEEDPETEPRPASCHTLAGAVRKDLFGDGPAEGQTPGDDEDCETDEASAVHSDLPWSEDESLPSSLSTDKPPSLGVSWARESRASYASAEDEDVCRYVAKMESCRLVTGKRIC